MLKSHHNRICTAYADSGIQTWKLSVVKFMGTMLAQWLECSPVGQVALGLILLRSRIEKGPGKLKVAGMTMTKSSECKLFYTNMGASTVCLICIIYKKVPSHLKNSCLEVRVSY